MKKLRFVSLFVVLLVSLVFTSSISAKDTSGLTGYWNGNTYKNDRLGFSFSIPKDWLILNQDQILTIAGVGNSVVADGLNTDADQLYASISETDTYLLYVMKSDGGAAYFIDLFDRNAGKVPNMTAQEYLQQTSAVLHASLGSIYDEIETEITNETDTISRLEIYLYVDDELVTCQLFIATEIDQYIVAEAYSINDVNKDAVWEDIKAIDSSFQHIN